MMIDLIKKIHNDQEVKALNRAEQLIPDDEKNAKKKTRLEGSRGCCGGGGEEEEEVRT